MRERMEGGAHTVLKTIIQKRKALRVERIVKERELHTEAIYNKWRRHRRQKQRPAAHHQRNRLDLCVIVYAITTVENVMPKSHESLVRYVHRAFFFFILNRLPFRGECAAR
jgi:mannosyltransferase OCH1-like enzyme